MTQPNTCNRYVFNWGAYMNPSGFKRGRVITRGTLEHCCSARTHGTPPVVPRYSKRDFLRAHAGGITPRQSASIH